MENLCYKWNLDDFKKVFSENNLKSAFIEKNNNNCVITLVDNFEEMKALFGNGRTQWAIAFKKIYWDNYVLNERKKQYVYADFSKDEKSQGRLFAFTYDPTSNKFTDAATSDNYEITGTVNERDATIRYILEHVFSLNIRNFLKLETPSTKISEIKREISELEDKYGVKLIIKEEEDC